MRTIDLIRKLESYPTFSPAIFRSLTGYDPAYSKVRLHRLLKAGYISRLQRNVYTVHRDPFLVASRIVWPSYISLWSALHFHGLTEQVPSEISVLTTRIKSRTVVNFMHSRIVFRNIPPHHFFGFSKVRQGDFDIFVAEPEKALLDAVLLEDISLSEIYSILKSSSASLSLERLVDYVQRAGEEEATRRFGWMLESLGLRKLRRVRFRREIPLDYARPPEGRLDRRWGVIVNL
ncbi:MAG: hypothetical protein QXK27_05475 [Candidatus Hadarchaeales archaeon]